jgi:uncharacterized protein YndB with AHSA1/START domain
MTARNRDADYDRELVITRLVHASPEAAFKAWTDPKQVKLWWGPEGFTNPVVEMDVRPGGKIRIDMRGPDGKVYPNTGVFHEVEAPERLVVSTTLVDGKGKTLIEDLNTVTFEDRGDQTELTLRARVIEAAPEAGVYLEGMEEGWNQTLDRFEEHLAHE